jgi:diguanylate cyclase (GGDEF)-like protein/PAS domain S-box-containing protein
MAHLAESMAGPLPLPAVSTVVRLADGSPFMGAAVLRGLVESGALVSGPGGWTVDEAALQDVQTARRSAVFLVRRLELLSPESLRLLSAGAVLGKEFDVELAVSLVGSAEQAATILDDARRRRLLWIDERTGRCSFAHDKIREALLERLGDDARGMLHSYAANALLKSGVTDVNVFDLAYHLDAAGRHEAALPYALRAAEIARAQHGLDSAVAHYRMAARGVAPDDVATHVEVAEGLGDVLILQGVYREAEERLSHARSLVDDRVHAAALEGKLGDLAFKQGDVTTARRHLEGAMRRLGRRVPQHPVVQVLWVLWEVLVQATHTALPRLTTGRRTPQETTTLAMRLYSRLAYLYWFHSGKVMCAWAHLRGMNLAERYPPSAELGQAWSEHAPAVTMLPWFSRALQYVERSLHVREDLGDVWGQGQSRNFAGVALYAASRFDDGAEACRESLRLLEATGDRWESLTASWNLAMCLHRKGELPQAAQVAREVYETALAIGDTTSGGIALSVWTRSTGGRIDPRLIERELARGTEDASTRTELLLAAALCAHQAGDLEGALRRLDDATATIRKAGLRQEYVAPVAPWRATVLRALAEQAPQRFTTVREAKLRAARRGVRVARFWAFSYGNQRPHAYREAGLVAALSGRDGRADHWLQRSLDVALEQGAAYEAALTRLAQAELAVARGGSAALLHDARAMVQSLEVHDQHDTGDGGTSVSVFDRFTTLLSVGRTIASATSIAAVEHATREAAQALLRGERCHLIDASALESDQLVSHSGEHVDEISYTLLARAVASGEPVVAADTNTDDSESLLLSGIRSVLAAPVVVHGEVRSLFYVTHRQVGQLFGEEEVQLAAFVATLAGAAYEHLAGTETRFRSLAQNSSDVLTLVDASGAVSYQSPAAQRVFGLAPGALVGRSIEDWVHPEDLARFTAALATSGEEVRIECRFRHADGSYRFAETAVNDLLEDPTVNALVLNTRDVTERHVLEDELRERALHDELTGLPNRALFMERLQHALDRRDPQPLVVCFLDLDDFKAVNDTLGHGAGDDLLTTIAERLSSCLRPGDTVARFGGDEFAVLLEETDLATAIVVAERILDRTAEPTHLDGTLVVAHTSIGLAPMHDGSRGEQLVAEADAAMYAAKSRGSHCYEVFDPAMRIATERRARMRHDLERALTGDELRLHYQPIVDLRTGQRLGVEALVRWQHPERGLLAPREFIDHAEESGQIAALGSWVLDTACDAARDLSLDGYMSINVSARQLQQADFVSHVAAALEAHGLPAQRLVLEITETAAVADFDGAIARLTELKALGVQLALDDFGTGYSPLSYLRRFPVDYLKIDRSFVAGIGNSDEDRAIVRGVIDMAHALGLRSVAEGVEDARQRQVLADLGCDLGQGYYWMAPVPLDELPGWGVPSPRAAEDLSTQVVPPFE